MAALALLASAGTAAAAQTATGNCVPADSWGALQPAKLEKQVIKLVNAHRATLGLRRLKQAASLTASAEWKSMNMAGYGYMQHDDPAPVSRTVSDRLAACGYPSTSAGWGENIAYGYPDAQTVVDAWLSDPPHRQNLENPSWTTIGVGAARNSAGLIYWAQDFGTTAGSSAPFVPPSLDTPSLSPEATTSITARPAPTPAPSIVTAFERRREPSPEGPFRLFVNAGELPRVYAGYPREHADGEIVLTGDGAANGELAHNPQGQREHSS